MSRFLLSGDARQDLSELWDWIAADNPRAADQLMEDILSACDCLADQPDMGSQRPQWLGPPFRFFVVRRSYWVIYDSESRPPEVLRVLHASRDLAGLFTTPTKHS
jgi:toxin ParE1/3/4